MANSFDEQLLNAARTAFINNPDTQSYGRVVDGKYQTVNRNQISLPSRATVSNLEGLTGASSATPTSRGTTARSARSPGEIDAPSFGPPAMNLNPETTLNSLGGLTGQYGSNAAMKNRAAMENLILRNQEANQAGNLDRLVQAGLNQFGIGSGKYKTSNISGLDAAIDFPGSVTKQGGTPTTAGQGGPTMGDLDSRAFDEAMSQAAAGNLGAIEEAFWGIANAEGGGDPKDPEKTPEELCAAAGGTMVDGVCTIVKEGEPDQEIDLDTYDFGDQEALIREQLGGLQTADLTAKITSLIDEARKGARSLNAETVRQIAAGYNLQERQIEAIAKAATETVKQTESMRTAAIDTLVADAATRVDQMVADQAANVASGTALAGPNQLTTEFAEVVTLTNSLVNSVAVGAKGSMGRIQAVANIAAAQRMAAPALMMADAKNALGAEKFALEGQAQMALEQTLNSLNVQEKEMIFNEALRIEQFNNNRDMALAQALINNGMAKLQYTIEEQRRDEDYARRQAEITQQRADAAQAALESKRRWQSEFGLKQETAAFAREDAEFAQGMAREQMDLSLAEEARLQEKQDAATLAALSGDTSDMGEARAVAQKIYGPNATESQIGALAAMSSAQRNTLLGDALDKLPTANIKPGSFEALTAEGFDEGVAQNAVTWVTNDRKIQAANANIMRFYDISTPQIAAAIKDDPDMDVDYPELVKDLPESQRAAATRDLEDFVKLQTANVNLMNDYESELQKLTGSPARKMNFQAAIDRISATSVFGLRDYAGANPYQQAAIGANWELFTPFTTYVDQASSAWIR